jgi:hypothetical protein
VDAFKPDQVPGAGGVGGGSADPAETVSIDTPVQMVNPDPDAPPGSLAAPTRQQSGTGVDSGVGGLY